MKTKTFEVVARDNTYNNENDLSSDFTWSIWSDDPDGDWCYADGVFVAICQHIGGDPRGNYGTPRLYRADDLAESGFLDWVVGWGCSWSRCPVYLDIEPRELTRKQASDIVLDVFDDQYSERISERCSIGYASSPSYELSTIADDRDDCYWEEGSAIIRVNGKWMVCTPYHYHAEITITEKSKEGWLCDATIDFDSFIENTLDGPDLLDGDWWDRIDFEGNGGGIEWDHDPRISEVIEAVLLKEEQE